MSSDDPCSEAEDRIESWLVRLIGVTPLPLLCLHDKATDVGPCRVLIQLERDSVSLIV